MVASWYSQSFRETGQEEEGEGEVEKQRAGVENGKRKSAGGVDVRSSSGSGNGNGRATSQEEGMETGAVNGEGMDEGTEAPGFKDEFAEPLHDITDLKRRAAKHTGQIASHAANQ